MYCSEEHLSTERTSDCLSLKGLYMYTYMYIYTYMHAVSKSIRNHLNASQSCIARAHECVCMYVCLWRGVSYFLLSLTRKIGKWSRSEASQRKREK
jgi:hypothetical protein